MFRFTGLLLAFALVLSGIAAPQVDAASSRPNPNANPRCPFGPGVARWPIKTSVPSGESPDNAQTVDLRDLIDAPDLEASPATVAAAERAVSGMSIAATTRGTFRWIRHKPGLNAVSHPFAFSLPAMTPQIVSEAHAIAHEAFNETGVTSSHYFALLAAQLRNERIPEPVAIGSATFREGDFVSTSGYVLASTCEEDDGDFHIDLGASRSASTCAVVEVPNPAYILQADLRHMVDQSEVSAKALRIGDYVTVTGQLFYDAAHGGGAAGGGRGVHRCARSLWEIHPVVRVARV